MDTMVPTHEGKCSVDLLRSNFDRLDLNKSDSIEMKELLTGLSNMGMIVSEENVKRVFDATDRNHNGLIDFNEFCRVTNVVKAQLEKMNEAKIIQVFRDLDTDKSGRLNYEEVKNGLKEMGIDKEDDDIRQCFDNFDTNKSGQLELDEFKNAIWTLMVG
ncbi:hypothetical protein ACOME3_006391 [Neoechinorhynchus agilis]